MLGAIIGDIVGSPYEFFNVYRRSEVKPFERTIHGSCRFTDDTVMTLAVARALVNNLNETDAIIEEEVARSLQTYYLKYPLKKKIFNVETNMDPYGKGFKRWVVGDVSQYREAKTNGAAMRVTSIGWLYNDLERALQVTELTVKRSHNSKEAIASAQAIVMAVLLARQKLDKTVIAKHLELKFGYIFPINKDELKFEVGKIRSENKKHRKIALFKERYNFIDCDSHSTARNAIYAFLISENFEDCIKTAISFGGDSDTIACMAGAIAEAYYGIPAEWERNAMNILEESCKSDDIVFINDFHKRFCAV